MKTFNSKNRFLYDLLSFILHGNLIISVLPLLLFLFMSKSWEYIYDIDNPFKMNDWFVWFIFLFTMVQCFYFILFWLEKILQATIEKKHFNWYFKRYLWIFFCLILWFSINYWILFQIDDRNYWNVLSTSFYEQLFDFFYFSFTNITTIGSSSIIAISRTSQFYLMVEVTMWIIMLWYFLGSFSNIQNSLNKHKSIFVDKRKR